MLGDSLQLLHLLEELVNHCVHVGQDLCRRGVEFSSRHFIKDNQTIDPLVESPVDLPVNDHLGEFLLDYPRLEVHLLRDVRQLDFGVRLDCFEQVQFQQVLVQILHVGLDDLVLADDILGGVDDLLELHKRILKPLITSFETKKNTFLIVSLVRHFVDSGESVL